MADGLGRAAVPGRFLNEPAERARDDRAGALDHIHYVLGAAELPIAREREEALEPHVRDAGESARLLRRASTDQVPPAAFDANWDPPADATNEPALRETAASVLRGEVSPRELVEAALERIERLDPKVEAFVTVRADQALEEADRLTGELSHSGPRGPLHGVPIAVKDLIEVAGVPTACGSRVREGHLAEADATAVRRLRDAGAIVIGKTTTHEFAYGPVCEPTRNAWHADHISGGSSGGSAVAVALEMAFAALGTDTGGSIRCPAAYNGVAGLKPTYGRVSKAGVVPLSWSLDHVGFMARDVRDMPALFEAMAGWDPLDPSSSRLPVKPIGELGEASLGGIRIGVAQNYFNDRTKIQADVLANYERALQQLIDLGAEPVDVRIEDVELSSAAQLGILMPEASAYHQEYIRSLAELYGDDVRPFIELGEIPSATHYINANRVRARVRDGFRRCFEDDRLDALVTPTLPLTAPRAGQSLVEYSEGIEESVMEPLLLWCAPANLTGQPVLSVPSGFDSTPLPTAISIVGRPFAEATVLRIGAAYQVATDWHKVRPRLVAEVAE